MTYLSLLLVPYLLMRATAFTSPSPATRGHSSLHQPSSPLIPTEPPSTILSMSSVADMPTEEDEKKKKGDSDSWVKTVGGYIPKLGKRKQQVTEVATIQDYKDVVVDEPDHIVCVRFYAPWCRACKAVQPLFRRLSETYPHVKFVEVPLTKENTFLHEGLGIPSMPYAHIYHPDVGLVDERGINKKVFGEFKQVLKTYVDGFCPIEEGEEEEEAFL